MSDQTTIFTDKTCLPLPNLLDSKKMIVVEWTAKYSGIDYAEDFKECIAKQVAELVHGVILHQVISWHLSFPLSGKEPDTPTMKRMIRHVFSKHEFAARSQYSSLDLGYPKINVQYLRDEDKNKIRNKLKDMFKSIFNKDKSKSKSKDIEKQFKIYQYAGRSGKFANVACSYKNMRIGIYANFFSFIAFVLSLIALYFSLKSIRLSEDHLALSEKIFAFSEKHLASSEKRLTLSENNLNDEIKKPRISNQAPSREQKSSSLQQNTNSEQTIQPSQPTSQEDI